MATTRQWLYRSYGHNDDTTVNCIMPFRLMNHCPFCKAKTLHVLLPAFCIAYSQSVPIFEGVLTSSG
jgi:hypothetical protein